MEPERPEKLISVHSCRARGWSNALLYRILGATVKTVLNPYHSTWAPMRAYRLPDVIAGESDPRWLEYRPEHERRCAAGKKGAKTRATRKKELAN